MQAEITAYIQGGEEGIAVLSGILLVYVRKAINMVLLSCILFEIY